MELLEKIGSLQAHVGIIGLGYVGLPLVREFAAKGFRVTGFDIDPRKVDQLNNGESYIKHIPSSLIKKLRADCRFEATTEYGRLSEVDCILICVPTPLDRMREPDLSYVEKSVESIALTLRKGQLVILESTTYPGTTDEVVNPILEKTGLKCGVDFFLAYSPEREDPGNPDFGTGTIPKVVGGVDEESGRLAAALYSKIVTQVITVSSTRVAESTKMLENIYRCINIALVNELKVLFDKMDIDVWEVIDAARTKPFGFQAFYPGPGLGGHCIPIDPFYLSWKAREYETPTRFIELAGEINTSMPDYVVWKLADALNAQGKALNGAKVLVLGAAYKKDVDDHRESPSIIIIEKLEAKGALVNYNDPHIPRFVKQRQHAIDLESLPLTEELLASQDAVLIATDHTAYDYDWIVRHSQLILDTRNATRGVKEGREKIFKA
ncbi:MAG: nucleotide sugar dehydrogenase [Planctomycetota bacterium]|jgi:UDP-N-acetyl-D-glucosamine dehydrogenase